MPPLFTFGRSSSSRTNKGTSNNSIYKCTSTNAVFREFEISRADARSRAGGGLGLGGRVFVSINGGKGNSICAYI